MNLRSFFLEKSGTAKWSLIIGLSLVLGLTAILAWWTLKTEQDVLFSRLAPQDAAALTRELEQMKIPYQLADQGATIMVEASKVHQIRLKLMGKELPLHGAVGFEIFNQSDFGMTEFAQKVNFQRALQGELTRTITSMAEIQSARVHLVLPEEGLFKRNSQKAKAAVTLTLKKGQSLRRDQVRGIQHLVAAAVPGIEPNQVTLVNEQGIALAHATDDENDHSVAASGAIEIKRDVETYLSQKANAILDKALGPGVALASVDVTLDMNHIKVTTEDILPGRGQSAANPSGLVIRERQTVKGLRPTESVSESSTSDSHRETEYQLGRRVEQLVSIPGSIQRLQVVAVLRTPISTQVQEQLRQMLAGSVGVVRERGDQVVVQSLTGWSLGASAPIEAGTPSAMPSDPMEPSRTSVLSARDVPSEFIAYISWAMIGVLVLSGVWYLARWNHRYVTADNAVKTSNAGLTEDEKKQELAYLQAWLMGQSSSSRPSEHIQ